ncbi:MAG: agmatine deiminase family protein [Bacteroidetes bacterium]|nr:agmatine deiminase family protein [Bacteroidota bacterium]
MKHRTLLILILLFISLTGTFAQSTRIPAEWEKQKEVFITWFGKTKRDTVTEAVIAALHRHVNITINVSDSSAIPAIQSRLESVATELKKITFVVDPKSGFWLRDAMIFIENGQDLKVVDFNYSMYGIYPEIYNMPIPESKKEIGRYDQRISKRLNVPIIKSEFVFEGGGIESNGNGTLLIIREMALQRNPGKSIQELENELKRVLGARKIIWLKDGLIEDKMFKNGGPFYKNYFGGGANMHVDELCRFVDDHTVVFPIIEKGTLENNPVDSINYQMLEENLKILEEAVTADGTPIEIVRVPVPDVESLKHPHTIESFESADFTDFGFNSGDTIFYIPACSYMNYFICNDVVLIPKYWHSGLPESQKEKDEVVLKIFSGLFPDREIIQIYTLGINQGGGGLHCMTHELPDISNNE